MANRTSNCLPHTISLCINLATGKLNIERFLNRDFRFLCSWITLHAKKSLSQLSTESTKEWTLLTPNIVGVEIFSSSSK